VITIQKTTTKKKNSNNYNKNNNKWLSLWLQVKQWWWK